MWNCKSICNACADTSSVATRPKRACISIMALAEAAGATMMGRDFNFLDPWGNHIEIVAYRDVQFSKRDDVLQSMGLDLRKSEQAQEQLRKKSVR